MEMVIMVSKNLEHNLNVIPFFVEKKNLTMQSKLRNFLFKVRRYLYLSQFWSKQSQNRCGATSGSESVAYAKQMLTRVSNLHIFVLGVQYSVQLLHRKRK